MLLIEATDPDIIPLMRSPGVSEYDPVAFIEFILYSVTVRSLSVNTDPVADANFSPSINVDGYCEILNCG